MDTEHKIGILVRKLRGGLSLRDFARKCDVSHTTIDNIEKGFDFRTGKPVQPKISTLEKIARACGVSVTYFTGADISDCIMLEEDLELIKMLGPITPLDELPVELDAVNVLLSISGRHIWSNQKQYYMDDVSISEEEVNELLNTIVLSVKSLSDLLYAKKKKEIMNFFQKKRPHS